MKCQIIIKLQLFVKTDHDHKYKHQEELLQPDESASKSFNMPMKMFSVTKFHIFMCCVPSKKRKVPLTEDWPEFLLTHVG